MRYCSVSYDNIIVNSQKEGYQLLSFRLSKDMHFSMNSFFFVFYFHQPHHLSGICRQAVDDHLP